MYLNEKKNNTKQNKSCLQDETCLGTKTESSKANYDTSMHMFERFQKSSDNLPATTPTPHPSPRHCAVLFFTQRLVSVHAYDVNTVEFRK